MSKAVYASLQAVQKQTISFDKLAMKDAMKNGNVIDGVQLVETQSIQIK